MLNAKEANTLTKIYYAEKAEAQKAKAENWIEQDVAPAVENAARSGQTTVALSNDLGQAEQRYAIEILTNLGYKVSAAHRVMNIRW